MRAKELSSQPEANAADARKASDRVSNGETQAPLDSYAPRLDARPGGTPIPANSLTPVILAGEDFESLVEEIRNRMEFMDKMTEPGLSAIPRLS